MTRTETWNGLKPFDIRASYFELLSTVNPVTVVAYNDQGNVIARDENVEAGYWIDRQAPGRSHIARMEITTSANEAVTFLYTDGTSGTKRSYIYRAQSRTLTLPGSATVGVTEGQVLSQALRSLVVFQSDPANTGTIALGPTGLATSTSPILLSPGDIWREEVASSAAWFARATVAAQTLRILTAV